MVPSDETQEGGTGEPVTGEPVTETTAAATEPAAADAPTDGVEGYVRPEDAPPADDTAPAGGTFEDAPKEDLDAEAVEAGDDPADAESEAARLAADEHEVTETGKDAVSRILNESADTVDDDEHEGLEHQDVERVAVDVQDAIDQTDNEVEDMLADEYGDIRTNPALLMLKGLADGTKSRDEGRAFIDENYPELNE